MISQLISFFLLNAKKKELVFVICIELKFDIQSADFNRSWILNVFSGINIDMNGIIIVFKPSIAQILLNTIK